MAAPGGDPTKPRVWSKHAQKPNQPRQSSQDSIPLDTKKDDKKKKVPSDLEQLKEDARFQEFLSVHQKRAQVAMWGNDALNTELPRARTKPASDYPNFNSDWDSGLESEEEPTGEEPEDLFDPSPPDVLDHLWGEVQKQENGQDVCLDPGWT